MTIHRACQFLHAKKHRSFRGVKQFGQFLFIGFYQAARYGAFHAEEWEGVMVLSSIPLV